MVKFVGGPSYGGYKSYINHTTAREGQWRMPRNYARGNVRIDVRNYNTCSCQSYCNTGFQLPAWLQWAQFGLSFLQGLFPAKQEAAQPETNPLQKQLEEMQKQIDDLKKENEDLKNKKPENTNGDPKVDNTPNEDDTNPEVDPNVQVDVTAQEDFEEKEAPPTIDYNKTVNFNVSRADCWDKIIEGYRGPNGEIPTGADKKEIIRQLRAKHFGGDQNKFFKGGKQNITENLLINGKTFTFKADNYYASTKKATDLNGTNITSVNTSSVAASTTNSGQKQKVSKGWSGVATVTWTDETGKPQSAKSDPVKGKGSEEEAKKAAKENAMAKVPDKYKSKVQVKTGAKEQ